MKQKKPPHPKRPLLTVLEWLAHDTKPKRQRNPLAALDPATRALHGVVAKRPARPERKTATPPAPWGLNLPPL
jgi:hypothetical protein